MRKFRWGKFFITLTIVLCVLGGILFGGYYLLDKAVVPKYFGEYGISNMHDLVGMMRTLYSTPHESQIITNGFGENDLISAADNLRGAKYPIKEDGSFDFDSFSQGQRGEGGIFLADREFAAVINKLLDSSEFSDLLPDLVNFNTLNIEVKEVTITLLDEGGEPQDHEVDQEDALDDLEVWSNTAHIKFIALIDTTNVRSLMADQMQIPLFLLNMIIPKTMYITLNYNVHIINENGQSAWEVSEGGLAVNGSTEKQSEVLLNLLIKFIFGDNTDMTPEKLLDDMANIIEQGVDLFGDVRFATVQGSIRPQNGIYFLPVEG